MGGGGSWFESQSEGKNIHGMWKLERKLLGRGRYKEQEEWMEEQKEEKQQRQILLEKCQIKSNFSILVKGLFKMLVVTICQIYMEYNTLLSKVN